MGVITSIRRNVKNAGRCSVFVDDVFLAACPIDVALALGLRKGLVMTDELEHTLRAEDKRMVLRQKAYRFATYKPRTERQMTTFLRTKEATDEEIEDVMVWLRSFGCVNDRLYAERFLDAARERKPLSRLRARQKLLEKGVPAHVVDDVMSAAYTEDVGMESARRVARKKLRMVSAATDSEREEKLRRFLTYRGYGFDVIRVIISELREGRLLMAGIVLAVAVCAPSVSSQEITTCLRRRLPESINRYQPTTQPVLSPDGRLFLDRKLHPDNADGGVNDPDDVWISEPDAAGQWTEPQRSAFTTVQRPDVVFSFTSDGLAALVAGPYRTDRGRQVQSLAILRRPSQRVPFDAVEPIVLPGVPDLGRNFYGYLADDRRTLVVALDLPSGTGGLDLYVSTKCTDRWSEPRSLGPTINTALFEGAPVLAPDGTTLYFASSGRDDRRGKADIYVTRRNGPSWTSWTTPTNLGSCINTKEDETAFCLLGTGDSALVHSWDPDADRPGIYVVELPADVRPLPSCRFSGRVLDARTGERVRGAQLSISDTSSSCAATEIAPDTADGTFRVDLASGRRYHVTTTADAYVRHHQVIGIRTLDSTVPLRVTTRMFDTRVPLASVYFNRGEAQLTDEAIAILARTVETYDLRQIDLLVTGYADVLGTPPLNRTLSEQRAESVAVELVRRGLADERVRWVGRGIENPGTLLGLRENPQSRRVDIFATERSGRRDVHDR